MCFYTPFIEIERAPCCAILTQPTSYHCATANTPVYAGTQRSNTGTVSHLSWQAGFILSADFGAARSFEKTWRSGQAHWKGAVHAIIDPFTNARCGGRLPWRRRT